MNYIIEQRKIDVDTGEILKTTIKSEATKESQANYLRDKHDMKKMNYLLGGFIQVMYTSDKLLFNGLLSPAEVSRTLYLATYINYENLLVKKGQHNKDIPMTKKDIYKVLKLNKSAFNSFINTLIEKNVLTENNGLYYLSTELFNKGKNKQKEGYTRLFIQTTRTLYESCSSRKHKQLGYCFQLIPFVHYEQNRICKNPQENNIFLINSFTLKELCKLLNISASNSSRFEKELLKFTVKYEGREIPVIRRVNINNSTTCFIFNPILVYSSKNQGIRKTLISLCAFNTTNKNNN